MERRPLVALAFYQLLSSNRGGPFTVYFVLFLADEKHASVAVGLVLLSASQIAWLLVNPGAIVLTLGLLGEMVLGVTFAVTAWFTYRFRPDVKVILDLGLVDRVSGPVRCERFLEGRAVNLYLTVDGRRFWVWNDGYSTPKESRDLYQGPRNRQTVVLEFASDDEKDGSAGEGWFLAVDGRPAPKPLWMTWKRVGPPS